jgi:hypothetical protein
MNLQIYNKFIVSPINGQNYINEIKVGDQTLIVNNSIENAEDVNRIGIVKSLPKNYKGVIQLGDLVITQHNVFRITYNDWGIPMFSTNHIKDDLYGITTDVIYLIIRDGKYIATDEFVLVEPIIEEDRWNGRRMLEDKGFAKYTNQDLLNQGIKAGDKVALKKNANYLFEIFGKKYYIMKTSRILAILN